MKTITQYIIDEIYYPISVGTVDNKLIKRGLVGSTQVTQEILASNSFKGALADCLYSLIQAVTFSEADKTVNAFTDKQREQILLRANKLYNEIGEEEVLLEPKPTVRFDF